MVLVEKVKEGCQGPKPDPNEIAAALDGGLAEVLKGGAAPADIPGAEAGGEGLEKPEENPEEGPEGKPAEGAEGGQKSSSPFAEWISTESNFFSLHLTGEVGRATVRIHAVIDLRGSGDIQEEPLESETPPAEGESAEEAKPAAEETKPMPSDASQWLLVYWKVY